MKTTFKSRYYPATLNPVLEHQRRSLLNFSYVGFFLIIFTFTFLMAEQLSSSQVILTIFAGYLATGIYTWFTMDGDLAELVITPFGANVYSVKDVLKASVNGVVYPINGINRQPYGFDLILKNEIYVFEDKDWPEIGEMERSLREMAG